MKIHFFVILCCFVKPAFATVILQYHHISDDTPAATSVSPALFRQHIAHLAAAGYTVLSLPDVVTDLKAGKELPDNSVVITFDDGYISVFTDAFPLLKAKGWPFTVFVNTKPLETGLAGFASWDQLNEMAGHGATIANHSHRHDHFLRRLENETEIQWRDRIRDDIETATTLIAKYTKQQHKLLAYPYGEYNNAIEKLVAEMGYVAFGQQSGPIAATSVANDWYALPRFPFGGNYGGIEDFKTKVATLAMSINSVTVIDNKTQQVLNDTLLPQHVDQPTLTIELTQAIDSPIQCFASGQGSIDVKVTGNKITAKALRPLPIGRSRYNCTAASNERGRFYWYSHLFIRKQPDGSWYQE